MADNCYVVGPLPSDNPPRTPFRRAALAQSLPQPPSGPAAPRILLAFYFRLPLRFPLPYPAATSRVSFALGCFDALLESASTSSAASRASRMCIPGWDRRFRDVALARKLDDFMTLSSVDDRFAYRYSNNGPQRELTLNFLSLISHFPAPD